MKCERCGREVPNEAVVLSPVGEKYAVLCKECASLFGTCAMCAHGTQCEFVSNPDPTPQFKIVRHGIQQGNATFFEQKQVPNGERIKKFCLDGKCKCAIDDPEQPFCCRHGGCGTCSNYTEIGSEDISND